MDETMNRKNRKPLCIGIAVCVAVLAVAAVILANALQPPASLEGSGTTGPGTPAGSTVTTAPTPNQVSDPTVLVVTHTTREMSNGLEDAEQVDFDVMDTYPLMQFAFPGNWGIYFYHSSAYRDILFSGEIVPPALRDAPVILEVTANYGELMRNYHNGECTFTQAIIGKQATFEAGQTFLWQGDEISRLMMSEPAYNQSMSAVLAQIGRVWVDIVAKVDGKIVGCMVFEMVNWQDVGLTVEYVGSDYYPPMDGQYQSISEAFVQQRIEAYHEAVCQ